MKSAQAAPGGATDPSFPRLPKDMALLAKFLHDQMTERGETIERATSQGVRIYPCLKIDRWNKASIVAPAPFRDPSSLPQNFLRLVARVGLQTQEV